MEDHFDIQRVEPPKNNIKASDFLIILLVGFIASMGFAAFWALFTNLMNVKWVFLGILGGVVVGVSIRSSCKSRSKTVPYIASIFGLLSCVVGDFLSSVGLIAQHEQLGYFDTLQKINYNYFLEIAFLDFDYFSLGVYFIAVISAYATCKGNAK